MTDFITPKRALLSVSDKTGLIELARQLVASGIELVSTGGTAKSLREAGLEVMDISAVTGFPEIMDGRVKTLHPKVHGGLLAKRNDDSHQQAASTHGIEMIDMLIVNLYPFAETLARGADHQTIIENIDIGGPAMIRAGAKNHAFCCVVTNPLDYPLVIEALGQSGGTSLGLRQKLAAGAFTHTAHYDSMISSWMNSAFEEQASLGDRLLGDRLLVQAEKISDLRYGENPHQSAALYKTRGADDTASLVNAELVQGKPLSFNNINDSDAALRLVAEFDRPAVAIIKHANPCGVAVQSKPDQSLSDLYQAAFTCDSVSAFGGIIALNRPLDEATATSITGIFTEVVIAPDADEAAKAVFAKKPNLRLLLTGSMPDIHAPSLQIRTIQGGLLVQDRDTGHIGEDELTCVTEKQASPAQMRDMLMAWKIAKHVKSNAIVYVKDGITAAIGAGQMSRLDSSRIAAQKAKDMALEHGWETPRTEGAVVASDAFFPFADGMLAAAEAGAKAVIQPGGAMRDEDVIKAANEAGLVMVMTGMRHFNH
ncbi:MAG: bifunctional phosphoribosylaminoimidazolecarboxamide formyltransferase/IMP cyclohydrolase [Candidatus Puniceispirillaceae bacterium]